MNNWWMNLDWNDKNWLLIVVNHVDRYGMLSYAHMLVCDVCVCISLADLKVIYLWNIFLSMKTVIEKYFSVSQIKL